MNEDVINKSESTNKTIARPLTEVGQPEIITSSRFIQDLKKKDLEMPKRLCTYENMMLDDAIANSVDVTNIQVTSALNQGKFIATGTSRKSKVAAEFLNYCIRNMGVNGLGTWLEAMTTAATDLVNGFAIENIVVEKAKSGKYKGSYVLKKLAGRDSKSVFGWVWDKNNRDLKGFVQKPMLVNKRDPNLPAYSNNISYDQLGGGYYQTSKYPFISIDQMLLFRHNPSFGNPQGNSPLNACYDAWTEKKLVEHFEVVGVSKDFGFY